MVSPALLKAGNTDASGKIQQEFCVNKYQKCLTSLLSEVNTTLSFF